LKKWRRWKEAERRYSNYESDFSRHNAIVALGAKF
jgi:outer membrane immunogenic protein